MKLPAEVKGIRSQLLARFPPPLGLAPGPAKEELFRLWCIRFAEQVAFALPGQGWGMKKASDTRPISKDSITQKQPDGTMMTWDLFGGVGTATTSVVADPTGFSLTAPQVFVEVAAIDHLAGAPPPPAPPEPPAPPPAEEPPTVDLDALFAEKLGPIEARLAAVEAKLAEPPAPKVPLYATFKIFGKTVRIPIK